jgi:hypothetical protein
LDFGGIFLGRASSIFSPVASGYELKNRLASPKNLLAKTSNNLLHNVLSQQFRAIKVAEMGAVKFLLLTLKCDLVLQPQLGYFNAAKKKRLLE